MVVMALGWGTAPTIAFSVVRVAECRCVLQVVFTGVEKRFYRVVFLAEHDACRIDQNVMLAHPRKTAGAHDDTADRLTLLDHKILDLTDHSF